MIRSQAEKQEYSIPFIITFNILVLAVIIFMAEVGRLTGVKDAPLPISVVWPPTGIALTGLLLVGPKITPGIFLGNFIYNTFHLHESHSILSIAALAGAIIASGSTLQALVGNYIMRAFCSRGYFNTIKDIFIFSLYGGALTCIIASSIGTLTLYFTSAMTWQATAYLWLTFWIGDTMGVYVFTPLLIVWSLANPTVKLKEYAFEAFFMVIYFISLTSLIQLKGYPLWHLYIPLSIWASYRFRMHGATLTTLLIALAIILPYTTKFTEYTPQLNYFLLISILYIEVVVGTSLLLAAIANEREVAWFQIQNHNINLQQVMEIQASEHRESAYRNLIQNKVASLGLLTSGITNQLQYGLQQIVISTKLNMEHLWQIESFFESIDAQFDLKFSADLHSHFKEMNQYFSEIIRWESNASELAKVIKEQSIIVSKIINTICPININLLIDKCLKKTRAAALKSYPDLVFTCEENFDKNIKIILITPQDLGYAFYHLFSSTIKLMKEKSDQQQDYKAILKVSTKDLPHGLEVTIWSNCLGIADKGIHPLVLSFMDDPLTEKTTMAYPNDLNLMLARDIIINTYEGDIAIESEFGEFLQFTVTLPKNSAEILRSPNAI